MATSYVGRASAHTKHHDSARMSYRDISRPSLGLDLRFEQTYLKTIAPHVRLTTPASDGNDVVQQLDIKWGKVIWITTRDQVLTPMFQGIIWGTFSPWVQSFRGIFAWSSTNGSSSKTGAGIVKLKSWLSSIIPQSATTSFRAK